MQKCRELGSVIPCDFYIPKRELNPCEPIQFYRCWGLIWLVMCQFYMEANPLRPVESLNNDRRKPRLRCCHPTCHAKKQQAFPKHFIHWAIATALARSSVIGFALPWSPWGTISRSKRSVVYLDLFWFGLPCSITRRSAFCHLHIISAHRLCKGPLLYHLVPRFLFSFKLLSYTATTLMLELMQHLLCWKAPFPVF